MPVEHSVNFSRLLESLLLEACSILQVVGTPAMRTEQVERLG